MVNLIRLTCDYNGCDHELDHVYRFGSTDILAGSHTIRWCNLHHEIFRDLFGKILLVRGGVVLARWKNSNISGELRDIDDFVSGKELEGILSIWTDEQISGLQDIDFIAVIYLGRHCVSLIEKLSMIVDLTWDGWECLESMEMRLSVNVENLTRFMVREGIFYLEGPSHLRSFGSINDFI